MRLLEGGSGKIPLSLAFSSSSSSSSSYLLYIGFDDGSLATLDIRRPRALLPTHPPTHKTKASVVLPLGEGEGGWVVSGGDDGKVVLSKVDGEGRVGEGVRGEGGGGHGDYVRGLAGVGEGVVVSGGWDGVVKGWRVES